jgi:polysaccharide biosynthesis PFTS motif protein
VSACWPERPEVAALSSMGLETINWSYGANTFLYAADDSRFRDLGMPRSISIAKEVWVWTELVERWLHSRALGEPPVIRVIGPVMCGDSRWLARAPQEARSALGLRVPPGQKLVAVFDVPAIRREWRHIPTMYPVEMLEQFFADAETILQRMPRLALLIKPKRALGDAQRDFPDRLRRILDPGSDWRRSGRVLAVAHDIDPYLPVAAADICIGIPFTSPVLVAHWAGRPAFFHDPLAVVRHVPGAPELAAGLTRSVEELTDRLAALLASPVEPSPHTDPGAGFAQRLRQAAALQSRLEEARSS